MKGKTYYHRSILIILAIVNSIITPRFATAEQSELNHVLIINSYHQSFAWTNMETEGITSTLSECGKNIQISIEYMDWKNYPTTRNVDYLLDYYKFKYQRKNIDLIITTDDAALRFALENRGDIFSDAPVVFCGVNQEGADSITEGYGNLTGVIEVIDPTETIRLALQINPEVKNVYIIHDNTESGMSTGSMVKDKIEINYPDLNVNSLNNKEVEDVIKIVGSLGDDSIVMMTTYSRDLSGRIFQMDYINREICNHSRVPVYHLYDYGLNKGTIGGILLSGKLQGENAAELALRIMEGENPDDIPFLTSKSTVSVVDYTLLKRFGISKEAIPDDIQIINKPFSFYETYKVYVLGVLAIIITLICFISILLFYIRRIRRMRKNLSESHEELTQLYEELTASDEEMKQQYEEILSINEKIRIGEEKLAFLAYHDVLTGLPNKLSLYEHAAEIFTPDSGKVALLFLDMDNFKNVNDTMGHAFGDILIKSFSDRVCSLLEDRSSIYRLSGDEFIVLLLDIEDNEEVHRKASEILSVIREDFVINDIVIRISVSIGVSIYPEHGNRLEALLKYADIAMYKVKENGRKNYIIYNSVMNEVFMERVNIEKHLHNALENHEFELHYQPQVDVKTNRITGFEALLRWNSPELGKVSPLKFIKVAEDTRYIIPLGTWVLKEACAFLKHLNHMGYQDLVVSVNISILQLLQPDFSELVVDTLKQLELEPRSLELEITESVLMESIESIEYELRKLSNMNVNIALDDFGKGYSSLNYLRQLPITTLKVDKSFIDCIIEDKMNALTGHIVTIGKSMGMSVVAEGVEKIEQKEYLMKFDCDKIQGYLFSKPLPEEDLVRLLEATTDKVAVARESEIG